MFVLSCQKVSKNTSENICSLKCFELFLFLCFKFDFHNNMTLI